MLLAMQRQILVDRARQEEDQHDRGRYPHRPIQIRVALENVEEVGTRDDGGEASLEDLVGVDVKVLRVEGDVP